MPLGRCQSRHYVPMEEQVLGHGGKLAEEARREGERVVSVQEDSGRAEPSKHGLKGFD